ncbi:hypothetical protein C8J56DRAFT_905300 [Mycena floridula]|nr:hypothetical protein C8J56DRAFT_905300 [Mycena floridula]
MSLYRQYLEGGLVSPFSVSRFDLDLELCVRVAIIPTSTNIQQNMDLFCIWDEPLMSMVVESIPNQTNPKRLNVVISPPNRDVEIPTLNISASPNISAPNTSASNTSAPYISAHHNSAPQLHPTALS